MVVLGGREWCLFLIVGERDKREGGCGSEADRRIVGLGGTAVSKGVSSEVVRETNKEAKLVLSLTHV